MPLAPRRRPTLAARTEALLARHWWQPRRSWLARLLMPLATLYALLLRRWQRRQPPAPPTPVPVVVVGNLVVGGAGKTPVVMALVQALREAGWHPGVISRGYGRDETTGTQSPLEVSASSDPAQVGDEPLLIRRRTGVPVVVARMRLAAARALCQQHPEVDVLVADDGLQHRALARAAEVLVFDERGIGNGLLLPAGPLREPLPAALSPQMRVLFSGATAAPLQPATRVHRRLGGAVPLAAWWRGDGSQARPLQQLRGRPLWALAGLASPEKFFAMLEDEGLAFERLPQPDHARYGGGAPWPWPAEATDVITTEKDAVKLPPDALGAVRVWVVGLDLALPAAWVAELSRLLRGAAPASQAHGQPAPTLPP